MTTTSVSTDDIARVNDEAGRIIALNLLTSSFALRLIAFATCSSASSMM
ncbi:MAG: hypothetical protein ACI3Z7_01430 [Candidatus Aphodosoma sp.]